MNFPIVNEIARGVRLFSIKTDMFKTAHVSLDIALPLSRNNIAANAVLVYLLQRSCKRYPDFSELNSRLDELYGAVLSATVSKIGEAQILSIAIASIDDRFSLDGDKVSESCADLLCDLLFEPNLSDNMFSDENVEREKRLLIEHADSELDDKRIYALRRCEEEMCKNEAYGKCKYGKNEEISKLTPADIYTAWQTLLKEATIVITVISSAGAETISEKFKNSFVKIEREPADITTEFVETANESKKTDESLPLKQGKLVMGFRAGVTGPTENSAALKVATDIFGGGTYSKLFTNVREKMSLCYYCRANFLRNKGIVIVQSGIETKNEKLATDAILAQLQSVQNAEISDSEHEACILSMSDQLNGINDTPETLLSWYSSQMLDEIIISPEQLIEQIKALSKEQIVETAKGITLDTVFMLSGTGMSDEDDE